MLRILSLLVTVVCTAGASLAQSPHIFSVTKSEVTFVSDAPLERITASSKVANGVLDLNTRSFAVRVPMRAFAGFNSPLQQEHFHENYVESKTHPNALFEGRIIETVDLDSAGTYEVRAKGRFSLHGSTKERIVPCTVTVTKEGIRVNSSFDVALADHGIRIPRVVQDKLAPVVKVKASFLFSAPAPKP